MNAINWPEGFIPGFTDNFVSNEMIISGLNVNDVWPLLSQPLLWPEYYKNSADVRFYDNKGPELENGVRFYFSTFGFPVEAQVVEFVPPAEGSLVNRRRGQPGNRQLMPGLAERALRIIRERYADFGPTLACEKLAEVHGLYLAKSR